MCKNLPKQMLKVTFCLHGGQFVELYQKGKALKIVLVYLKKLYELFYWLKKLIILARFELKKLTGLF